MKYLIFLAVCLFSSFGSSATNSSEEEGHIAHTKEQHMHGPMCGHKAVKHNDHIDYIDQGIFHAAHKDHYDLHGVSFAQKAGRALASSSHFVVDEQNHKHGPNCGHKAVMHGDHIDYIHDGHYHAAHADHFDDHGVL